MSSRVLTNIGQDTSTNDGADDGWLVGIELVGNDVGQFVSPNLVGLLVIGDLVGLTEGCDEGCLEG
jgi:hypothetical protein